MPSRKYSIEWIAVLAVFTVIIFATAAPGQTEKILYSFRGTDGGSPGAGLIFDASGNLYGTTALWGTYGYGTAFELSPTSGGGWTEKVLHDFGNGKDGQSPEAGLVFDASGNLYGTTYQGGIYDFGMVFALAPEASGGWTERVLYNFENSDTGQCPTAGLIFDASGDLYGTAFGGVCGGEGVVFELTRKAGGGWSEKVLYDFQDDYLEGKYPEGGLIFGSHGILYGTTQLGGVYGSGTVFELAPGKDGSWAENLPHSFNDNGKDGKYPQAGLVLDTAGNLYGTTYEGGNATTCSTVSCGTVFELKPKADGGWTEKLLHSFNDNGTDGYNPVAGLILDAAGNLYGTTTFGGAYNAGTVFGLSPAVDGSWTETILYSFNNNGVDGNGPSSGLVFDSAGNLYGTTQYGGPEGYGTVFEITP